MAYIWAVLVTSFVTILLTWLHLFYKKQFSYWKNRGVKFAKPSFPFGNLGEANRTKTLGDVIQGVYEGAKDEPYIGMWTLYKPTLLIRDPDLIKKITIQDFPSFHDHANYFNEEKDPLSAHLFSLKGAEWRNVRAKMSPTFTSGRMKLMFPTLVDCSNELVKLMEATASGSFDCKDVLSKFTMEIVSLVAFGIESNSMKESDALFVRMGRKFFEPTFSVIWKNTLAFLVPDLAARLQLVITPRDVSEFFMKLFKDNFNYRQENGVKRNDVMQLLIDLTTKGYIEDVDAVKKEDNVQEDAKKRQPFTMDQAAAQAFVFFIGGSETSATTMQLALYELARNPDIQERVRRDIRASLAKNDGKLTYEGVTDMVYLDRVIAESLRMYPPAPFMDRVCTKDYIIPESNLKIDKGTTVHFSMKGLHYDPRYFPNPTKFDPDRFTEEEKSKRPNFAYLPFGDGPRICIGQRFALLQVKVGLATLLSHFQFDVCKETLIPMVFDPKSLVQLPKGGLFLKVSKLT